VEGGGSGVLECQSCGAALQIAAAARTAVCPYCASPSVVERPPSPDRPDPTFVLAFVLAKDAALSAVKAWIRQKRGMFSHSGLARASVDDVRGVYVPSYLYGAVARSSWAATIGEDYTEEETYTDRDEKGNLVTKTRTVTRTEHVPLQGAHAAYVRDVVVTASRGIANAELEHIEPFDLRALARFTAAAISGWHAEEPTMAAAACLETARAEAMTHVGQMLGAFMPGDSHRDLQSRTTFDHEIFDLLLAPVWVLAVRYDAKKPPLRVLVNGQTGRVAGAVPLSWIKVTIAIVFVVAIIAGLVALVVWKESAR
jgi:hypothetical protein